MGTKATWRGGILTFFDDTTHERVAPLAPVVFYDDFVGSSLVVPAGGAAESGMDWVTKIVGAAPPTVAGVASAGNGVMQCALTSAAQKQDAGLYMGDQRCFSLEQGLVWECRAKLSVLPTDVAEIVFGLVGDWADGPDNITYSLFFTADGSGLIYCEKDDDATDQSATSGITVVNTAWHTYRIDATVVSDIKFFIDGVGVATGTTFGYAATGANAILQPYFGPYKAAGAGVGTIQVDYCRIWQKRS